MVDVVMLGFTDVLLPLIGWVSLFFLVTLIGGILMTVWCRGRLQQGKQPTGIATAFMVIILCMALPVFAIYMSFSFALQRGVGNLLEKGGRSIVEWSVKLGADAFQQSMGIQDQESLVDLTDLRKRFKSNKKPLAILPEPEAGRPLAMVAVLPAFVEAMFWESMHRAVKSMDKKDQQITWKELRVKAEQELADEGEKGFKEAGMRLHEGAGKSLKSMAGVVLALNLLAMLLCALFAGPNKLSEKST